MRNHRILLGVLSILGLAAVAIAQSNRSYGPSQLWWDAGSRVNFPWQEDYDNPDGMVGIRNSRMMPTEGHAFFEALGTNNRACITCHQPANAMSISTATLLTRWNETQGADPVFAAFDGSNCPTLPQNKIASHSLLLERGLFRIPLAWPPKGVTPDFKLEVVSDPANCNTDPAHGLHSPHPTVSVYRRPRVVANLKYIATLMADAREATLESQAISAIFGHEQATAHPTAEQLSQIVAFERQVFTAQSADLRGGLLTGSDAPALLGPDNVAEGKAVNLREAALLSFAAWKNPSDERIQDIQLEFRQSAARGSELFFHKTFALPGGTRSTCASCHNEGLATGAMNIGTTDPEPRTPLPVFRLTCKDRTLETTDPGRALITGRCADAGAIVMQQFRGLAARAPYFSNGSARTLGDVIDFYDRRFAIGLTKQERQDLLSFLKVL